MERVLRGRFAGPDFLSIFNGQKLNKENDFSCLGTNHIINKSKFQTLSMMHGLLLGVNGNSIMVISHHQHSVDGGTDIFSTKIDLLMCQLSNHREACPRISVRS